MNKIIYPASKTWYIINETNYGVVQPNQSLKTASTIEQFTDSTSWCTRLHELGIKFDCESSQEYFLEDEEIDPELLQCVCHEE